MALYIVLGVAVLVALWLVMLYNRLVKLRNFVREGWSGIDIQLKKRANLIPNLVETVKGYMTHERETLENVIAMRNAAVSEDSPAERGRKEGMLASALGNIFALAENYPDLKANTTFLDLQRNLSEIEDQIQLARRYYNGTVRNLNNAVETFPSNLVAGMFGFSTAEYFRIEDGAERAVPKVDMGLS